MISIGLLTQILQNNMDSTKWLHVIALIYGILCVIILNFRRSKHRPYDDEIDRYRDLLLYAKLILIGVVIAIAYLDTYLPEY